MSQPSVAAASRGRNHPLPQPRVVATVRCRTAEHQAMTVNKAQGFTLKECKSSI